MSAVDRVHSSLITHHPNATPKFMPRLDQRPDSQPNDQRASDQPASQPVLSTTRCTPPTSPQALATLPRTQFGEGTLTAVPHLALYSIRQSHQEGERVLQSRFQAFTCAILQGLWWRALLVFACCVRGTIQPHGALYDTKPHPRF
jgi:hypothetical protein